MEQKTLLKRVGDFANIILNGTALAIVAGLIANAVLSTLLKYLGTMFAPELFATLAQAMYLLQFSVPVLVGIAVGATLKFKPLETATLGAAILAGSGSLTKVTVDGKALWTAVPMGDLFNVMLTAAIAALAIQLVRDKFGSLTIIFLPIVGGGIPAAIGLFTLPYMKAFTHFLADTVLTFTTLQPLLMCILIAMTFSLFIVTPVSTVGMSLILFQTGNPLGAGAAGLGVVSAAMVLAIGSTRAKNPSGVAIAVILGAMKMMMPNIARRPQLLLPIMTTGAATGLAGYLFSLSADASTGGFGIVGLIGPVKSHDLGASWIAVLIGYLIVPLVVGFIADRVFSSLKLYTADAYKVQNLG